VGVFAALDKIKFAGWTIVELDGVPDKAKTPKQCAQISKDFLQAKIAYQF
jgi:inosose dehydratase